MKYEYDIAISYKSEMEKQAKRIADYLKTDGWKVFFAPSNQQELLSENAYSKLYDLYKNKSLFKLLIVSQGYLSGEWTTLEKRVALESTKENRKRLLIVNYTGQSALPGDLSELNYLDGTKLHEDEVASYVTERIKRYLLPLSAKSDADNIHEIPSGTAKGMVNHGIIAGDNSHFNNIKF